LSDVLAALERWSGVRGASPALDDGARRLSYGRLLRRVGAVAAALAEAPSTVGLLAPHGIDWAVAELGVEAAGRTFVPLPDFFSDAQLRHVVADAGVTAALAESGAEERRAASLGLSVIPIPQGEAALAAGSRGGAARVVYTSGSSGAPKGVRLGARQLASAGRALLEAVGAGPADVHLSMLPYALLLESLCGLRAPLLAGASVRLVRARTQAELPAALLAAAAEARPTTSVLTPLLLAAWTGALEAGLAATPRSLRFVAVGGAAAPEALLRRAQAQGLPAFQGYGLTECGSVVSVNRPGADRLGSCGRPLPGVEARIADDGEILVRSPALMDGYVGSPSPAGEWRTGDLGALDADGYLWVHGRKDNLIVRPSGRNLSPEWIETMLDADPRIARSAVVQTPDGMLLALLEPAAAGAEAGVDLAALLADAPAYARPDRAIWLKPGGFAERGLLTANGRPRRAALSLAAEF
jgi:long-subunit acyl-CoA synthetase (AMP-forming)